MRVVAIGGGGGATQVLHAVASFASHRTAIIAVTDSGRSTGLARTIGSMPAPGDLRATIASFAADAEIATLLQHRFDGTGAPQLAGMAFGNLLLAALHQTSGDFAAAVARAAQLAQCTIAVLPVATADVQLCAELTDGSHQVGELAVRAPGKPAIARLYLDQPAPAYPPALAAIAAADLVVLGPGSLFTTVLATLQHDGLPQALASTAARVVYVCNTTTQPGQTDRLRAADHVARIAAALGPGVLDTALLNRSQVPDAVRQRYAADGLELLVPDESEIGALAAWVAHVHVAPLTESQGEARVLWNKQDTIRHDPAALGAALRAIAEEPR